MNQAPEKCAVRSTCSTLNALACISEAWSSLTGIGGWEGVTERCVCPSRQEEHRGRKQPGCDISTGWVTDVQLYKVAFMTGGEDLCEIWVSRASVPPYIENIVDSIEGVGRGAERKGVSVSSVSDTLKNETRFLRVSLVSVLLSCC